MYGGVRGSERKWVLYKKFHFIIILKRGDILSILEIKQTFEVFLLVCDKAELSKTDVSHCPILFSWQQKKLLQFRAKQYKLQSTTYGDKTSCLTLSTSLFSFRYMPFNQQAQSTLKHRKGSPVTVLYGLNSHISGKWNRTYPERSSPKLTSHKHSRSLQPIVT